MRPKPSYRRYRPRALATDRRGASAIEFAIVGPVFILLCLMIIQLALELFSQLTLDMGLGWMSRQAMMGTVNRSTPTLDGFRTALCGSYTMTLFVSCNSSLQVYIASAPSFKEIPLATVVNGALQPNSASFGGPGDSVLIQVAYPIPYFVPWLSQITGGSGALLTSTVALKNEPY